MAMEFIRLPEGPDPVLKAASDISSKGQDFQTLYTSLYGLIEGDLANNWEGSDYDVFHSKIEEERMHFDSMRDVIEEYATTLRNAINAHVQREEDSKGQAAQGASFN
ncbi:MAG: hypothetical protein NC177_02550 [Ruminococcus flavefaciens]|nr:hypothetical protein [Ruminococcus flavefaciens]